MDLSLPNDNESCREIYWGYNAAAASAVDNGTADKRARRVEKVEDEEERALVVDRRRRRSSRGV